ncbi:flagellar basal body-associated FliL family protein [Flaviflagellibacter deserti]|uniref:Flagellar protein FliL n=1 Tax=Flaviflagellibacter deserti TaxID=2267266 RepID=A0ABV9Z6S1_9HYPH
MANVADAAEEIEGGKEAKKSKFSKKMLMIAGGVVLLAAAGGGYLVMGHGGGEKAAEAHAEATPPTFVDLPDIMVNLAVSTDRPKYLKAKIALEVADEEAGHKVEPMVPRVVDSFQVHLREMRPEDLEGSAAVYRLKEELLRRINQAVYPAKVDAILFKELLIQ